jgi:hypothetical protein
VSTLPGLEIYRSLRYCFSRTFGMLYRFLNSYKHRQWRVVVDELGILFKRVRCLRGVKVELHSVSILDMDYRMCPSIYYAFKVEWLMSLFVDRNIEGITPQ